jgi:IAA-amino acid hydrolase
MCHEGALESPRVERIFGLHVWPATRTGEIASRAGTFLAATGFMKIHMKGVGGHAAMPHLTVDPLSTSAKLVCELQTIISREVDPLQSGVVSVTTFHAGDATNIIPQEVHLSGTMRSLTMEGLLFQQKRIREITMHVAAANRCEATVEFPGSNFPATVNNPHLWQLARQIGSGLLGAGAVHESPPIMGGEDFAFFAERIPGCFVGLGIRNEEIGSTWGLHHPRFKVDEAALPIGTALHVEFALRSLEECRRRVVV